MSRVVLIAAVVLFLAAGIASTLYTDHQSCLRTNNTRTALQQSYRAAASRLAERATVEIGEKRTLDLQAQAAAVVTAGQESSLDCSRLFAPTR